MKMFASTEARPVQVVVVLVACWSLMFALSDASGTVAVRHRSHHSVDRRSSTGESAADQDVCEPANLGVDVPASCQLCGTLPEHLRVGCCRWCVADKATFVRGDVDDQLAAADADKRVKFFLGKRPKYFLGK